MELDEGLFEIDCWRCGSTLEGDPNRWPSYSKEPVKCPECHWEGYSRFNEATAGQIENEMEKSSKRDSSKVTGFKAGVLG